MKVSMKEKPDRSILHVGTNDLKSDRPSHLIAKSIVDLVITLKNNSQNVRDSNIIISESYLKQLCTEKNIFLIDLIKTIHSRNINIKLHLNKSGNIILSCNFVKASSSILH